MPSHRLSVITAIPRLGADEVDGQVIEPSFMKKFELLRPSAEYEELTHKRGTKREGRSRIKMFAQSKTN